MLLSLSACAKKKEESKETPAETPAQTEAEPSPAAVSKQGNPALLLGGICAAAGIVICLIALSRSKKNKKYKGRH